MKTVTIPVYEYDELSEEVQTKVTTETIQSMIETFDGSAASCSDGLYKAITEAEKMQTPWFTVEYVWDYCKEEVLELCRDWMYFKDGRVYREETY